MLRASLRPVAAALLAAILLIAIAAPGQARIVRGHSHGGGFFLRLSAGLGGADTGPEIQGDDPVFSGASGDLNIAIGGVVSPGLALHGTLWGWSINEPELEWLGAEGWVPGDLSLSAIGGGVTYYFMPSNLYLSGSLGFATLSLDLDETELAKSDTGLALDFTVGKEWWVGARWGLGVAGAFGYHSVPGDAGEDWSGKSVAIRFSATYN
jgi:hypothetical protein